MVEGAALEILRGTVRFVHQKPCNHAGFTQFEKLNNLLFFPSVLSKAFFYEHIGSGIEVVITGLTRNRVGQWPV